MTENKQAIDFGRKLEQRRLQLGMSQVELCGHIERATGSKCAKMTIYRMEKGKNPKLPARETIEAIATALQTKVEYLVGSNDSFFERFEEFEVELMKNEETTAYIKVALAKYLKDKAEAEEALNRKFQTEMFYGKA